MELNEEKTNGIENPAFKDDEFESKGKAKEPQEDGKVVKDWKYFWKRIIEDMTNKDLIPIKILFFFKFATLFVLYPFLTLHMKALGLNEWEIGVNQAATPIVALIGPPIAGVIADRIGNFKAVLVVITFIKAGLALLLLVVPVARETIPLDNMTYFELRCDQHSGEFLLSSLNQGSCQNLQPNLTPLSLTVECGYLCHNETDFQRDENALAALECTRKGGITACHINVRQRLSWEPNTDLTFSKDWGLVPTTEGQSNVTNIRTQGHITFNGTKYEDFKCEELSSYNLTTACPPACRVQLETSLFCSDKTYQKVYDVVATFILYILFRILLGLASATSFIMFEGAVLAILKEFGGDYGLQRVSATLAAIIAAPVSGLILGKLGFQPVFFLYAVLNIFSALLTLKIDLAFKKPAEKILSHLIEVVSNLEILLFFLVMFLSGCAWGYLETFLFIYLKKLGASAFLMGLTISVGGLAGLPLLIFSRPIIKRLGPINVISLGLFFYFIRYFGYAIIYDPWMCLLFEALEAFTTSLALTAAATYAVQLSTIQTIASIQGIFGGLYFGIGRGAGSFVGGYLINQYGHRNVFKIYGCLSLASAIFYTLCNIFYLRHHSKTKNGLEIYKSKETEPSTSHRKSIGENTDNLKSSDFQSAYVGPLEVDIFTDIPLEESSSMNGGSRKNSRKDSHPEAQN